jgi:hypothetical protein
MSGHEISVYEAQREEAALLEEDAAAHPEDTTAGAVLWQAAGGLPLLVNRTPRQLRLARATVRRWEAGKIRGSLARERYEKACAVLLSAALGKDL